MIKPDIAIVNKKVNDLIPYINNARVHSDDQINQIAASIKEFGFTNPILIDGENGIIAGHGRVLASKKLNIDKVPTIELSHLTETQKKAYILADNKLALNAGWDDDLLSLELLNLRELDFDLDLIGFGEDELDQIIQTSAEQCEGNTDPDEVPEVTEKPKTRRGDVWLLGNHRLMCGDCTNVDDVTKCVNESKIDLVFSDPPYGIDVVKSKTVGGGGRTKFKSTGTIVSGCIVNAREYSKIIGDETTETAQEFYNTCVSMGMSNIVLWGGNYFTDFLNPSRCWIIWDKEMTGNFSEAEMAWTSFSKGGIKVFKFLWNGLSREGNRKDELKKRAHPTQKPVGLFQMIFERFDGFRTIFDGFGGSGSTMIACEKTNRVCYMMELDTHYCDVIVNRWQNFTGKEAILESTGETYNSIQV